MAFFILMIKLMSSDIFFPFLYHSKLLNHCWVTTSGVCWVKSERLKNETNHLRLVGYSFNKQGNFLLRLALDSDKISRSFHLPTRIMKVHGRALTRFSNVFSPSSLNTTLLSEGCILEMAASMKIVGQTYTAKRTREM